jgi:23S rRNA pseudouridine1911/1915/1917 synthase
MAAKFIREGLIRVRNEIKKPGYRVKADDIISGRIPAPEPISCEPEAITLNILHEDNDIVVISKPAGMVVHPAPGHFSGTLVNAILHHCPNLEGIGGKIRPGIVHRLDKDTSGILVVAKTAAAQVNLSAQFKNRTLQKTYLALVSGKMKTAGGVIDLPIGRHPVDRKKMSVLSKRNRDARTLWRVRELFDAASFLEIEIKTGRTHQIRVHCASIQHPVVGDAVYGYRNSGANLPGVLKTVTRQMLHAWRMVFTHPATGEKIFLEAPIPEDMLQVLSGLRTIHA